MVIRVGLLDLGRDMQATISCARLADSIGYSRYWLAEHHAENDAWASPEIAIGMLCMLTKRMKVGSAGTLVHFHNPLRTACDFRFLASNFPGRVDLGIARGAPSLAANRTFLSDGSGDDYESRVALLVDLVRQNGLETSDLLALPKIVDKSPNVWVLGTSVRAAEAALRHGAAYSHGTFFDHDPLEIMKFGLDSNIAIAGLCGFDEGEAQSIVNRSRLGFRPHVVGSAAECMDAIEELGARYGVPEVIFLDLAVTEHYRRRTIVQIGAEMMRRGLT